MYHVKIGKEAREEMVQALSTIAQAIGSTLGPGGRPFAYDKYGPDMRLQATFSKDGLTVLRSLGFDQPAWGAILQYCKQAAAHSVLASGDGPQPLWSKVLTPTGFMPMSEIKVGMEVCGTDGTIQEVVGVFPKGEREIYEVEFANAGVVECCADHLWTVTNTATLPCKQQTLTTAELYANYHKQKSTGQNEYRYYTPRTQVEFYSNRAEMPLDPYTVGVLLGDGSLSGTGSVELSLGIKKQHIINKLRLPEGFYLSSSFVENKNSYRVKINGKCQKTGKKISEILNSIGLLGTKSATKFIPKSYLYAATEDRKSLLQGLLDTDGHLNEHGLFEFSSASEEMANDFKDLCRSLGLSLFFYKMERKDGASYSMTPIFRVCQLKGYKYGDKIIRITPTNKTTQMQCIKVSNPNSLYITDNYVATHNTSSTIVLAAAVAEAIMSSSTKMPPQAFARMLEREAAASIEAIKQEAITGDRAVRLVALTSTNGDSELTDIVLEAVKKSSAFGTILAERNPASKVRYRILTQDGYSHCMGYDYNNTLAWSASEKAASNDAIEWENSHVAIFNGNIMTSSQLEPILAAWNECIKLGDERNLVIFSYEISDEIANKLLVVNRTLAGNSSSARAFIVKPRLSSEVNSGLQVIRDIAAFCGVMEDNIIDGGNYKTVSPKFFGSCGKIKITPSNTILMGRATNHWVERRVQQNLNIISDARAQHDKEVTALRNAQLTEGLVKVEVGGGLMPDLQERADRLDDATKAAQACMRNGALPGCGASYVRAAHLANVGPELSNALSIIHSLIMHNRGLEPLKEFDAGETVHISEDGAVKGDCQLLRVMDACDTVCAVIGNGVSLGIKVATLGGYSLRNGKSSEQDY